MDKNLFLLTRDEIKLLQDISTFPVSFQGFNGFQDVRDRVDVVIQEAGGGSIGCGEYINDLDNEAAVIIAAIDEELQKRRTEDSDRRAPRLPNYEDPENPEPWNWWEDYEDDDFSDILDAICEPVDDGAWLSERETLRRDRLDLERENEKRRRRDLYPLALSEFITRRALAGQYKLDALIAEISQEEEGLGYVPGRLADWDLIQLDARLARIKQQKLRLHVNYKNSLLGAYVRLWDKQGLTGRRVYLFIDNIHSFAYNKGIPDENILAETFAHEMFHAWYADLKSKNFLLNYLFGVTQVEEAMTEYGMLCFLEQFNRGYFATARKNVADEFASGDPSLMCYGLGEYLFQMWPGAKLFGDKQLAVYQKVSPSPRLGNRLVRYYVSAIVKSSAMPSTCMRLLRILLEDYDQKISSSGKHFSFNGSQYGYSSRMALAVLREYASIRGSNYPQMDQDFHQGTGAVFFQKKVDVMAQHKENSYDMENVIVLSDGTEVVMVKAWTSEGGGITERFVTRVASLNSRGILSDKVHLLR